jgi:hypothetical protein
MTGTTWSKFYWSDWESDEKLKLCSPGAQALWMRMLCICAKAEGYLIVAGEKLNEDDMARLTGWPLRDVKKWWAELKRWEVFSVEGRGKVYSRKMVRAVKASQIGHETGKLGGNPTLTKRKRKSPTVKGAANVRSGVRARINHEPDTRSKPPKPPEGAFDLIAPDFEKAWAAYPESGKATSNLEKSRAAFDAELVGAGGCAPLRRAVEAYAEHVAAAGLKAKSPPAFHRWLTDRRWQAFAKPDIGAGSAWSGPPDVWAAVVAERDEAFARSWLLTCAWQDVPTRALITPSATTIARLRREIGPLLTSLGVEILERAA